MHDDSKHGAHVQRTSRVAFGMVDSGVIRDPSLPTNVRTIYTYLATFCGDDRSAYPSRSRMARETGLSVRTVDGALKIAQQVGLMTVVRRRDGDVNQTNLYLLHDLGGGYVIGSGANGGGAGAAPGVAQDMHEGGAGVAPELDQVNKTSSNKTTDTSSDASAAVAHEQARGARPTPKLYTPRNLYDLDDGEAHQYLVAASIAALRAAGRQPAPDAADRIGQALRVTANTEPRERVVEMLRRTLELAGSDDPKWGDLTTLDPWVQAS